MFVSCGEEARQVAGLGGQSMCVGQCVYVLLISVSTLGYEWVRRNGLQGSW